jgi:HEAT repeat protein
VSEKDILKLYSSSRWDIRLKTVKLTLQFVKTKKDFAQTMLLKATYDDNRAVRIEAIKSLSYLKTATIEKRLQDIIKNSKDGDERWYALKTLALFNNPQNSTLFISAFNSTDWLQREAAVKGFLSIRDLKEQYKYVPFILQALNDEKISVVITTLNNLEIKDDRIYSLLSDKLKEEAEKENRFSMVSALLSALKGYTLDLKTRDVVIDYLVHPNVTIRLKAYRVLKEEKEIKENFDE